MQSAVARIIYNEADMAYRRRVSTIFEWLDPRGGDRILDGGCGRGFYLQYIREVCAAEVVGLELDQKIAAAAQADAGNDPLISLACGSLDALPFAEAAFDKAILSEVLEHVEDDVGALRRVARAVKQGGLIAITVPNANYPFWWDPLNKTLEAAFDTHISRGLLAGIWANHVRLYTDDQLCSVVAAAGLEIVAIRRFTHACFPFSHNLVYGFGKTALEAGILPGQVAAAADRRQVSGHRGGVLNPINLGLRVFEWFDRSNVMEEPRGRSTVNLCVLARR